MTGKLSFTKYEHECLPAFRQRINKAESVEDVRRVFGHTTRFLMEKIFSGEAIFRDEDVILDVSEKSGFSLSPVYFQRKSSSRPGTTQICPAWSGVSQKQRRVGSSIWRNTLRRPTPRSGCDVLSRRFFPVIDPTRA